MAGYHYNQMPLGYGYGPPVAEYRWPPAPRPLPPPHATHASHATHAALAHSHPAYSQHPPVARGMGPACGLGPAHDIASRKPSMQRAFEETSVHSVPEGTEVRLTDGMCVDRHLPDLLICLECWFHKHLGEPRNPLRPWRLYSVDLSRNRLSDESICKLMGMFKSFEVRVRRLRLPGNSIKENGLNMITEYIWNCTEAVLELDLADNEIIAGLTSGATPGSDALSAFLRCLYNHSSYPYTVNDRQFGVKVTPLLLRLGGNMISHPRTLVRNIQEKGGVEHVRICPSLEPYQHSGKEFLSVCMPDLKLQRQQDCQLDKPPSHRSRHDGHSEQRKHRHYHEQQHQQQHQKEQQQQLVQPQHQQQQQHQQKQPPVGSLVDSKPREMPQDIGVATARLVVVSDPTGRKQRREKKRKRVDAGVAPGIAPPQLQHLTSRISGHHRDEEHDRSLLHVAESSENLEGKSRGHERPIRQPQSPRQPQAKPQPRGIDYSSSGSDEPEERRRRKHSSAPEPTGVAEGQIIADGSTNTSGRETAGGEPIIDSNVDSQTTRKPRSLNPQEQQELRRNVDTRLALIDGLPNDDDTRDTLAEFVVCMAEVRKIRAEMVEELGGFLGEHAGPFADWFDDLLTTRFGA